ncbi:MAG: cytochrome c [Vicinamibacterales bacterium]
MRTRLMGVFRPHLGVALLAAAALAGCRQDMHDTPRYEAYEANASMPDGRASRNLPAGTVARGQLRDDEHFYTGKVNGAFVAEFPFAIGEADLRRGQERFTIYCTPCHGQLGDGRGMVVQRGLRQAATYHQDRLRNEPIGYIYDVISNGFGAMQGYAEQVPPRDRWLIAAYVRALQLSQNVKAEDVPAADRSRLDEGPIGVAPAGAPPAAAAPPSER